MGTWRDHPATDRQKAFLSEEGIRFPPTITKGEASDLIESALPAEERDLDILHFFKVPGAGSMNQREARKKVHEILAEQENKEKWKGRGATKGQKEIYRFFDLEIPRGLKWKDAEKVIDGLRDDEEKWKQWEQYEDELDDRQFRLEDLHETIADYRDFYDCKKIGKKLLGRIVEELEASGHTLDQLEEESDFSTIYTKA